MKMYESKRYLVVLSLLGGIGWFAMAQRTSSVADDRFVQVANSIDPKSDKTRVVEKKLRLASLFHADNTKQMAAVAAPELTDAESDVYVYIIGLISMLEKNDLWRAKLLVERLMKDHKDNPIVLRLAAQFELRKENPKKEKARELLKRSIERAPYYAQAYYDLACLTSEYEETVEYCYRILVLEPRGSSLASNTIDLLQNRKKVEPK